MAINEFRSPKWDKNGTGIQALESFDFHTERYMIWIGIGYMWVLFVFLTIVTAIGFAYFGKEKKKSVIIDDKQLARAKKLAMERKRRLEEQNNDFEKAIGDEMNNINENKNALTSSSLPFQPITITFQNIR